MGDLMKAISNDMHDYRQLCQKYGEKPVPYEKGFAGDVDAYGPHARSLFAREERERKQWIELEKLFPEGSEKRIISSLKADGHVDELCRWGRGGPTDDTIHAMNARMRAAGLELEIRGDGSGGSLITQCLRLVPIASKSQGPAS